MFFDYPDQPSGQSRGDAVVFRDLRSADWDKLVGYMRSERFAAGDVVLKAGEDDATLYFLAEGQVEVLAPPGLFGQRRLAVISQGSVFGEIGFFDRRPRSATVRALTDVVALSLPRERFEAMAVWEPAIARVILIDLGRVLSRRLRVMLEGGPR